MNCLSCEVKMRVGAITRDVKENDLIHLRRCHSCQKLIAGYCRKCVKEKLELTQPYMNRALGVKKKEHYLEYHSSVDLV